jgi:tetratricopeptide (TPR) repeat protein
MMSRTYLILILLVLLLGLAHTVWAEVPKIASTPLRVDTTELNKLWFEALNLLNNKALKEANLKLKDLDLKKLEAGLKNLPDHSAVLITYANTLKKQGQLPEAIKLLESGKQLSPDVAAVYFALAKFRFALNKLDAYGVGRDLLRGVILKYNDIQTILIYTNNGLSFVLLTGLITGVVFILFSFVYYQRAIFYSVKEMLPVPFPTFIANILGWVSLGVVTSVFGVFWGIFFLALLLILIPHLESASKRVLQGFLLFGSLLAVLLIVVSVTFTVFQGNYFQALRDVSYGTYSTRTIKTLQKRLQDYPDDTYALFGLAYIARNVGNLEDAVKTYEMIASQYPDQAAVQNNLGNLYQRQFRETKQPAWSQKAEEAYRSAIFSAPKMFEPHYNMGQLLLLQYKPEDAQEQIVAARKLNNDRFILYSGYLENGIFSIDVSFSTVALLKRLSDQEFRNSGLVLAENLWASGSRFKNPWFFSVGSFVLLLISSLFGTKKGDQRKSINYCQMCGDPYPVKRKKTEAPDKLCTQCTSIFKKKTAIKPEKRAEKIKQIEFRQKIRGLIAKVGSLCIPGSGQIYFGYIAKGVIVSFVFYLGFTVFLLKVYTRTLLETEGGAGFSLVTLIISLLLVFGAYLFNIYDIFNLSPKNQ